VHTTEPLVPEPNSFEVEVAPEYMKGYKWTFSDQIPAELIQAGGR